jgi:hypothetical protein
MNAYNIILLLAILIFIAFIYTYIGLRFSLFKKKSKRLTHYFILGLIIGLAGGFILFYNLEIMKDVVYFNIRFGRWLLMTILSIFSGGLISFYIYFKIIKK